MSTAGSAPGGQVVSVVIPTYDRLPRLQRVVAALEAQTVGAERLEVVVVSDGSTDGTEAWLAGLATPLRLVWASQHNAGPAAARNTGLGLASAPLVLFLDDDVVPAPTLVATHLAAHARAGPRHVVLGPMLTPDDHDMSAWVTYEQRMLEKQYDAMRSGAWAPTARQFYTGNASIPRHLVLEAGGFDEAFARAEDVELAYRLADAGVGFVFEAGAEGLHYAQRSYASWLGTAAAYGNNDVVFALERGQAWLLATVAEEYPGNHVANRWLAAACVGRGTLTAVLLRVLTAAARLLGGTRSHRAQQAALSATYNLAYYAAFDAALRIRGGRLVVGPRTLEVRRPSLGRCADGGEVAAPRGRAPA